MLRLSKRLVASRAVLAPRLFSAGTEGGAGTSDEQGKKPAPTSGGTGPAFNLDALLNRIDAASRRTSMNLKSRPKKAATRERGPLQSQGHAGKQDHYSKAYASPRPAKGAAGKQNNRPWQPHQSSPPDTQEKSKHTKRPAAAQDLSGASAAFGSQPASDQSQAPTFSRDPSGSDMPAVPLFALSEDMSAFSAVVEPRRRPATSSPSKKRFAPRRTGQRSGLDGASATHATSWTRTKPRGVRRLAGTRKPDSRPARPQYTGQVAPREEYPPTMPAAKAQELIMSRVGTSNNRIEIYEYSVEALTKYLPRTALAYNQGVWTSMQAQKDVPRPRFAGHYKHDYLEHNGKSYGHALNTNPSYDLEHKQFIAQAAEGKISPAEIRKTILP